MFRGDDPRFCDCRSKLVPIVQCRSIPSGRTWGFHGSNRWIAVTQGGRGRFHGDDPRFWDFQSDWVPFSASSNPSNSQAQSDWPLIVLIFNPIEPLFLNLQSNWPPFLNPVRSDWVHFSSLCWASIPKFCWVTPPPRLWPRCSFPTASGYVIATDWVTKELPKSIVWMQDIFHWIFTKYPTILLQIVLIMFKNT